MQGLLKLGQSREDKLKRVTLKVDEADITFALQVYLLNWSLLMFCGLILLSNVEVFFPYIFFLNRESVSFEIVFNQSAHK